jgi:O-acetyl-ADP-ribose deacetylase (regulator of RNase III)
MIKYIAKGDIFESNVEAYVNPVNLFGVMGAGLAADFKIEFPGNFSYYKSISDKGETSLGKMVIYKVTKQENKNYDDLIIINFPTKSSWKWPSKLEYIDMGLRDLIKIIKENNIKSIAVPGLGCGNGQLNWSDVKPLMEKHFEELQDVEIEIYEPKVKSWGRPKIKK